MKTPEYERIEDELDGDTIAEPWDFAIQYDEDGDDEEDDE